mmetsp:Transcript_25705/g.53129  ORF Transcript_25705/g.53129 Transcript_25705/m.53129 type:complete len:240 (-) Transcript_25705:146-865(-)
MRPSLTSITAIVHGSATSLTPPIVLNSIELRVNVPRSQQPPFLVGSLVRIPGFLGIVRSDSIAAPSFDVVATSAIREPLPVTTIVSLPRTTTAGLRRILPRFQKGTVTSSFETVIPAVGKRRNMTTAFPPHRELVALFAHFHVFPMHVHVASIAHFKVTVVIQAFVARVEEGIALPAAVVGFPSDIAGVGSIRMKTPPAETPAPVAHVRPFAVSSLVVVVGNGNIFHAVSLGSIIQWLI